MPPVMDALADASSAASRPIVQNRDRLLFLELLARVSLSLQREERAVLASLAEPHMPAAYDLLTDSDPEFRALGVQLIGLIGTDEGRPHVIDAMNDPAPLVALAAIRALARIGRSGDVEQVLEVLPRFEKWGPVLLTTILASFGDWSRPTLRTVMSDENRPERQRVAAAGALLKLNDFESADIAEKIIEASPGRELSAACLRLIKRLGRSEHAALMRRLASAEDPVIRLHAVSALSALGGDDDADLLTMAVMDPSHWVAMRASRGLRDMNQIDRLKQLASRDHPTARLAQEYLKSEASYA